MGALITQPLPLGLDAADAPPTDLLDQVGASIGQAAQDGYPARLLRGSIADSETNLATGEQQGTVTGATTWDGRPVGPLLSADEANQHYSIPGQKPLFDGDIAQSAAEDRYQASISALTRQSIIDRGLQGVLPWAARTGASLLTSIATDPLSDLTFAIPWVGEANAARILALGGRSMVARAALSTGIGAADGAIGTAALQPLDYAMSRSDGEDWTGVNALMNVAYGAAMGGVMHGAGRLGGDAWAQFRGQPLPGTAPVAEAPQPSEPAPTPAEPSPVAGVAAALEGPAVPEQPGAGPQPSPAMAAPAPPVPDYPAQLDTLRRNGDYGTYYDTLMARADALSGTDAADLPPGYMLAHGGLDSDTAGIISHLQSGLDDPSLSADDRADLSRQLDQVVESTRPSIGQAMANLEAFREEDGRVVRSLMAGGPDADAAAVNQQLTAASEQWRRMQAIQQVVQDSLPIEAKEAGMRTALAELAHAGQVDHAGDAVAAALADTPPSYPPPDGVSVIAPGDRQGLLDWIKQALATSGNKMRAWLGPVSDANVRAVSDQTGTDIGGFRRVWEQSQLRHIDKKHGPNAVSSRNGAMDITPEQMAKVYDVVNAPDRVAQSVTDNGRDALLYEKKLGDYYVYVEEVRSGRRAVAIDTMYRRPTPDDAAFAKAAERVRAKGEASGLLDARSATPASPELYVQDEAGSDPIVAQSGAPGEVPPSDAQASAMADRAAATPPAADGAPEAGRRVAEAEADVRRLREGGAIPADDPEVAAAADLSTQAEREAKVYDAVAGCLTKGIL